MYGLYSEHVCPNLMKCKVHFIPDLNRSLFNVESLKRAKANVMWALIPELPFLLRIFLLI